MEPSRKGHQKSLINKLTSVFHASVLLLIMNSYLMFALHDYRRGVAGNVKGQGTRGPVPDASWGPDWGVGAWTVAMETATTSRSFAPSHTSGVK